jgi:hypothetical protein
MAIDRYVSGRRRRRREIAAAESGSTVVRPTGPDGRTDRRTTSFAGRSALRSHVLLIAVRCLSSCLGSTTTTSTLSKRPLSASKVKESSSPQQKKRTEIQATAVDEQPEDSPLYAGESKKTMDKAEAKPVTDEARKTKASKLSSKKVLENSSGQKQSRPRHRDVSTMVEDKLQNQQTQTLTMATDTAEREKGELDCLTNEKSRKLKRTILQQREKLEEVEHILLEKPDDGVSVRRPRNRPVLNIVCGFPLVERDVLLLPPTIDDDDDDSPQQPVTTTDLFDKLLATIDAEEQEARKRRRLRKKEEEASVDREIGKHALDYDNALCLTKKSKGGKQK